MENEIWKDVIGYEGLYQISNSGRVKSLGNNKFKKEKILKDCNDYRGYYKVSLSKNGNVKLRKIHQLVAIAFLNHKPDGTSKIVVDHINDIKTDNRVENLQIITQRENAFKTQGNYTSNYKGVHLKKGRNKWDANITINRKTVYLGSFKDEYKAYQAYQNKLEELMLK